MVNTVRMAVRQIRQSPMFVGVTVVVLSLGTAAAATIYAVVDTVVLRPLPYEDPNRLVTIWDTNAGQALSHDPISPVNFMDQRDLPVFADAAAWWRPGVNLADPGLDPVRLNTLEVSGNLFEVLGVRPQVGAGFPAGGPLFVQNEPVAVISDRLWRSRYGADPSVVGRQLQFNGTPYTVLAVMPPGFHFPDNVDVWQRLMWDMTQHSRSAHFMEAVARLSDETTLEQAQAAVDSLWTRIVQEFGTSFNSPGRGWGSRLIPLLDDQLGYYRPALFVLFGSVGLLMFICVLNVTSLLLTRTLSRGRELAIRVAMGASRSRLVAQLMTEGLVLAVGGAVLGVAVAAAAVPLMVALTPVEIPRLEDAAISWPVLGLGLGVAAVTTLVFGVVPALLLGRGRVTTDLKSGERGSSRMPRRLYSGVVVAEIALACALLVSSALLVRTVQHMVKTPVGVGAGDTLITTVQLPRSSASSGVPRDQWSAFADTHARILDAIRSQPGVRAAGASNFLPFEIGWRVGFSLADRPPPANPMDAPQAQLHSVSDGYWEAMAASLAAGRPFNAFDGGSGNPVVIVNQAFARRYFPAVAAVGQTVGIRATNVGPLGFNLMATGSPGPAGVPFEVVGVVDDMSNVPLGQTVEPALYVPLRQFPFSDVFVAVDAVSTEAATSAVRRALQAAAPQVPLGPARTWGDRFGERTAEPRLLMSVLLVFGGLAGLLAALGVYGLFSWSVALRSRELAIRLALGARPWSVGGLVVRDGVLLVGVGLATGVIIVRFAERALTMVLYQVSPGDSGSAAAAGGLLLAAALVACLPPALRAMRVDPVEGLRGE